MIARLSESMGALSLSSSPSLRLSPSLSLFARRMLGVAPFFRARSVYGSRCRRARGIEPRLETCTPCAGGGDGWGILISALTGRLPLMLPLPLPLPLLLPHLLPLLPCSSLRRRLQRLSHPGPSPSQSPSLSSSLSLCLYFGFWSLSCVPQTVLACPPKPHCARHG